MFGLIKKEDLKEVGISEKQFNLAIQEVTIQVFEKLKETHEDSKSYLKSLEKSNEERHRYTTHKIEEVDKKIEGEYISPQNWRAIEYARDKKAEDILKKQGIQLSLDDVIDNKTMVIDEIIETEMRLKKQYNQDLGSLKSKILVSLKKYLGMKGNAPNSHIKRKDVDISIDYIRNLRSSDL